MFMTLKPPKKGSAKSGMEQISFTEAGQGGAERRFGANRRNSCAYCQSKKLRCTGSRACCDKCKAHGVLCIIPPAPRTKKAAARTVARERRVAEEHAGEIVGSRESHPVSNLESVGLSLSGSFQSLPTPDKDTSPPAPTLQDWGIDIGAFGKDLVTIDSHDFMGFDNPKTYDLVPQDVPEWSNPHHHQVASVRV
uniref:Zn(2)-C6 fungal-type domain-containing protein n=1 Tax=Bionectria ochroleuca TaxID=29856 RepID=A0A8H7N542_BIOOC